VPLLTASPPSRTSLSLYGHIDGSTHASHVMLIFVDGSPSFTVNPTYTSWKQQEQQLASLLIASLTEETLLKFSIM